MTRSGAELTLLLLGGFRALAEKGAAELAELGHPDVRPAHDFALRSISAGAESASELARRMSVTKQAAAKTIAVLEERDYVTREADPVDRRRTRLRVTKRGDELLRAGDEVFDGLRREWEKQVGIGAISDLERALRELVGTRTIRFDATNGSSGDPDAT
jgi:DNA-binding MarR family transcriptional regulator